MKNYIIGVRARNVRKDVIDTFKMAYKLKTLPEGAIVREWPMGFSVWFEDVKEEEGYRLLANFRGIFIYLLIYFILVIGSK